MSEEIKTVEGFTPEQQAEHEADIAELMRLAFMVHQKTDFCVFINFAGHVQLVDINIRKSTDNWDAKVADCKFYINTDCEDIKSKIAIMDYILKHNEIPAEMCDKIRSKEYIYLF